MIGLKFISKLEKNKKQSHAKTQMLLTSPNMYPAHFLCILSDFDTVNCR